MKKGQFSQEQIVAALHQAESGAWVAEVCRKVGITEQTVYRSTVGNTSSPGPPGPPGPPDHCAKAQLLRQKPCQGPDGAEELKIRPRDLAAARVRYGYGRLHVLLPREGGKVRTLPIRGCAGSTCRKACRLG